MRRWSVPVGFSGTMPIRHKSSWATREAWRSAGSSPRSVIAIRKELLIPILCGIFLVENLSVVSRCYFKYTKKKYGEGRRIFRMSPLHHHYQKLGYHEAKSFRASDRRDHARDRHDGNTQTPLTVIMSETHPNSNNASGRKRLVKLGAAESGVGAAILAIRKGSMCLFRHGA